MKPNASGAIIAFSGKGGSGKTTLTAMTLRRLIRSGIKPILAVDADPNATLAAMLGVKVSGTIADLRNEMRQAAQKISEIPKERLMDRWLAEMLTEESGFDMLTMGQPEGPGCYCYVNGLLRRYLSILRKNYSCVLVDCEAGMEYLSRLVVDDVEAMVLVAEATPMGLKTAGRIAELAETLPVHVHRRALAVNKVGQYDLPQEPLPTGSIPNVDMVIHVPFDADLGRRCARGEAIDDEAGPTARDSIEKLANWCAGLSKQAQPTTTRKD